MAKNWIPKDLEGVLTENDINSIFFYFEHEFHLSKQYRYDYHSLYLQHRKTIVNEPEFFCQYLVKNVEPILKQLLRRNDNVSFAAIRYLLHDRINTGKGKMFINRK